MLCQYCFRLTNSSTFQFMVTVVFKYNRHFLLLSLHSWKQLQTLEHLAAPAHAHRAQPSLAGTAASSPLKPKFGVLLGTLLFSGGWSWPSSACHHCPQHFSFCGNNLPTGAHKDSGSFWKQNSLRGVESNHKQRLQNKIQNAASAWPSCQPRAQEKEHFRGILSDWGETDWPAGYTNIPSVTGAEWSLKGFLNCEL